MNPSESLPGPRYPCLLQVLRTAEVVWNASRIFFARWDMSPSQFNILNLLRGAADGISQMELSTMLIMHRSNVTGLVDRLEERKWVKRQPSLDDRRVWRVTLTRAGSELMREILPEYYRVIERVWEGTSIKAAKEVAAELKGLERGAEVLSHELTGKKGGKEKCERDHAAKRGT